MMHDYLQAYLSRYNALENSLDWENALKEIIQEVCLRALSHANFFENGAFYGGTCLRIFYKLLRFSEDLDFSLIKPNERFSFSPFFEEIKSQLDLLGFQVDVSKREKVKKSNVESAFIKGNTSINLLQIECPENIRSKINPGMKLKVKFEVDVNPPEGAGYEVKQLLLPYPYSVKVYDLPSLYAGKMHALLCRNWKQRVKGRDFYDFIWYVSRGEVLNLAHLEARMIQTGHIDSELTEEQLFALLHERFEEVDFNQAKEDVFPFIRNTQELNAWSKDFFLSLIPQIKFQ